MNNIGITHQINIFILILKKRKERNTLGDNLLDIEQGSQDDGSIYGLTSYE